MQTYSMNGLWKYGISSNMPTTQIKGFLLKMTPFYFNNFQIAGIVILA